MQRKLAMWTTDDQSRRIDRLLRLISHPLWLEEAARITLSAKGADTPGVDGITRQHLKPVLETVLYDLRHALLSETYTPSPARRIYIPKANGKQRPLGIPCLKDRIVQRAMLMAMEPIWESDFHQRSYGFRPSRSVHHAVRALKMQLTDGGGNSLAGRWVIEGDMSSYFDTVHHRLLMKAIRKRVSDTRFLNLLWLFLKAGHIDGGLFLAANKGVPQGGVISPLISNIMLNEFDYYLEQHHLSQRVRKHRYRWNASIENGNPIALAQDRKRKPTISYCRYADDFVITVSGTKKQAELLRIECQMFLEDKLKLTLNMDKTAITHVNDGFTFLGHRFIRKPRANGDMRVVTTIPKEKARNFSASLAKLLSKEHDRDNAEMIEKINRKIDGWANFYQFVDYKAKVFHHIDQVVFWKLAHWLAKKYRTKIKSLLIRWIKRPSNSVAKTWFVRRRAVNGELKDIFLKRLVGRGKRRANFPSVVVNPYLMVNKSTLHSGFDEIAMAFSRD